MALEVRYGLITFLVLLCSACATSPVTQPAPFERNPIRLDSDYFGVRFIDAATKRGIPLIGIRSINGVSYYSDSAGWIAINPADFGTQNVYFYVESPGYRGTDEKPNFRGVRVKIEPGRGRAIQLHRTNIAHRLYRITGDGIYLDSRKLGIEPPIDIDPTPAGNVFGQDSVLNAILGDKLYWFWGDTTRPDSRLGNFKVAGATTPLPPYPGFHIDRGIVPNYFLDENGFTKSMTPIEGPGTVWLAGLMSFPEGEGDEQHMYARYDRRENRRGLVESGIVKWNEELSVFQKLSDLSPRQPLFPRGDPILRFYQGEPWFYFGTIFPHIRVRARESDILDQSRYEAFTCLKTGSVWNEDNPPLERNSAGMLVCDWKANTSFISPKNWAGLIEQGLVSVDEYRNRLVSHDNGELITPHSGSVQWSYYKNRWILIAVQLFGSSVLGEVWYAESDSPLGPWDNVRKILTHDEYSFYNVKQHEYFARGQYLYFEGTFSKAYTQRKSPIPRYNYNQIMYRLDLDDPRLTGGEEVSEQGQ